MRVFVCLIQFECATERGEREEEKKELSSTVTIVLVAGTDVRPTLTVNSTSTSKATLSTVLNQTRVKTTPTNMLLHNNSLKYVQDFSLCT